MEPVSDDLLPGERLLWTERSDGGGRSVSEWLGLAALSVMAVASVAYATVTWQAGVPWSVRAAVLVLLSGWWTQLLLDARRLLRVRPAVRRSLVYRVTDLRVVVSSTDGTASWWLDQLPEPVVRGCDLVFRSARPTSLFELVADSFRSQPVAGWMPRLRALTDAEAVRRTVTQAAQTMAAGADRGDQAVTPLGGLPPGFTPAPGERVLWTGRPAKVSWWYGPRDARQALAAVLFTLAAVLVNWDFPAPVQPATTAIPVAVGLAATIGGPLLRRARVASSVYVLTDRRLTAIWRLRRPTVREANLATLGPPAVLDGNVVCAPTRRERPTGTAVWPLACGQAPVLLGLADPQEAVLAISTAQLAHRVRGAAAP
ncbi:hypothetical protein [Kitasatospora sp. MAP5-34]|uniref:hypothetical protein n=1 Tax=Kitasatospora sp. MAP5-34 TaxID=3035102 RepID=UPI002473FCE3|nr:hypothetical protein [Kitasatospora sp. MAP5-34]MDH6574401.1 hypothetical protein [Kitasatospora sp. MAP5-34]